MIQQKELQRKQEVSSILTKIQTSHITTATTSEGVINTMHHIARLGQTAERRDFEVDNELGWATIQRAANNARTIAMDHDGYKRHQARIDEAMAQVQRHTSRIQTETMTIEQVKDSTLQNDAGVADVFEQLAQRITALENRAAESSISEAEQQSLQEHKARKPTLEEVAENAKTDSEDRIIACQRRIKKKKKTYRKQR